MEAIKFDEKSLSRFPVAFYFSAVEAFGKRIGAVVNIVAASSSRNDKIRFMMICFFNFFVFVS